MKIAIICSSFFPVIDGVTISVYKRLERVSQLGYRVKVFCPDYSAIAHIYPDYQKYTGEIFPNIEIINLPSNKAIALNFERDLKLKSYGIIADKLLEFRPDLIHVDEAERLGICLLKLPGIKYAKQHNIPCVAWFHTNYIDYCDDYFSLPFGGNRAIENILKTIFAKIYNAYDLTLVSSKNTARKLEDMGIKNICRAELLGCDMSQFNLVQKEHDFFNARYQIANIDNKIKLIFIGRLTPDKGWNFGLQSLTALSSEIRDRVAIIIAGDGTLKHEIERTLKQTIPNVYLLGRVPPQEIPALLTNGDIFVTNSAKETRGLTLIEAAAAGIPAIAPRAGGVIDTIEDGVTSLLYRHQDCEDFLNKLTLLISNNDLRQSMGKQAKIQAQQWDWSNTVDNLIEIWQKEIAKK